MKDRSLKKKKVKIKYYIRKPTIQPVYAQDYPTHIMVGRFAHLYCSAFNMWFVVIPGPEDIQSLKRANTVINQINRKEFIIRAGPRAYLEIIEDKIGIRLTHIARALRKLPGLKKIKWLKKLAYIDELQDWEEWKKEAKFPIAGEWME